MAGLVPAIHVNGPPILQEIVDWVARHGEMAANLFPFLKLDHVDGRDEPGHDGVD